MKDLIICDLDGTLADCTHRLHLVQKQDGTGLKKKPDWDAFYAGVRGDRVNAPVMAVVGAMLDTGDVIFCTGRPERCREDTEWWLRRLGLTQHDYTLLMRADGDYRADYIVKQELLDKYIDKDRVLFVLDDRQQVVDMWRRNGLPCFQVAPGNF